jgi:outer membrane protein TolC
VDATGSFYQERLPADLSSQGQSITVEQYSVNLGVSAWEIDFFGRLRSLERAALEEYLATEEAERTARILLIAETANGWLTLAADREKLELARSTLDTQQATSEVLLRRPDVLAAERRLKAANANIGSARAALFPRISLTTAFGTASAELSDLFAAGQDTWNFAPCIGIPIFDPRTWAALDVGKVEREILIEW